MGDDMNDPCPNCGMIDFEDECGFCKLSKEYALLKTKSKEMRDILKDAVTTSEDPTTWVHEMTATIDEVIDEYDKLSGANGKG